MFERRKNGYKTLFSEIILLFLLLLFVKSLSIKEYVETDINDDEVGTVRFTKSAVIEFAAAVCAHEHRRCREANVNGERSLSE